jgi:hypothetical protein
MPEVKTEELTVQPKADKRLVIIQKEDRFVPKIKLKMTDGSVLVVPQDAQANKNASIILAEHARKFVTDQIQLLDKKGRVLTPQEIKDLVTAAKLANEMAIVAHEDIMIPSEKPGKPGSSTTSAMLKAVEAAAKGITSGNAEAQAKALEKFVALGRKEKKAGVIDVVATPVP